MKERNSFNISMQRNRLASDGTHVKASRGVGVRKRSFYPLQFNLLRFCDYGPQSQDTYMYKDKYLNDKLYLKTKSTLKKKYMI